MLRNGLRICRSNLVHVRDRQIPKILHSPSASQPRQRSIAFAHSLEFTIPNNKSNAVRDIVLPDTSLRGDEQTSGNYTKALHLLKCNPPECRIDVRLPYSQYLRLERSWSKFKRENKIREDKKYPRLSYNSLEQIATVVTVQRALHEVAAIWLGSNIKHRVDEYLSSHKFDDEERILEGGSTTRKSIDGKYANSLNDPDGSFYYKRRDGGYQLQIAVEVGFIENYKALLRDKDTWIQSQRAKVVVLVFLKESPQFKNPKAAYKDVEDVDMERTKLGQLADEVKQRNKGKGPYGPIEYRCHNWFEKLNEAFIEVWRADGSSPNKLCLIENGRPCDPLPTVIGLKVSDFFSEDAWAAAQIPDSYVPFDWDRYRRSLLTAMGLPAEERFIEFL
ncbi:uncharacterized protein V1513DRAFT_386400 [Lipomyces chichibuensis]|uniref:uncharacterized protein n=1 Tax=Lipomyces chichibuensis TaxID=1546026 RepID=UPI0033434501